MYEITVGGSSEPRVYTVGKEEMLLLTRVFKGVTKVVEIQLPDQEDSSIILGNERDRQTD